MASGCWLDDGKHGALREALQTEILLRGDFIRHAEFSDFLSDDSLRQVVHGFLRAERVYFHFPLPIFSYLFRFWRTRKAT